jgi:predicted O-methyltransferase YrrM
VFHRKSLFRIAQKEDFLDQTTKPLDYYKKYETFLKNQNLTPKSILEIGTHKGLSTKIFSAAFPRATILTVDIESSNADFSKFDKIKTMQSDQTDKVKITRS